MFIWCFCFAKTEQIYHNAVTAALSPRSRAFRCRSNQDATRNHIEEGPSIKQDVAMGRFRWDICVFGVTITQKLSKMEYTAAITPRSSAIRCRSNRDATPNLIKKVFSNLK